MSITECKCESPQEALERFEEAVRNDEHHKTMVTLHGESDGQEEAQQEYEEAKADLLIWMLRS